MEIAAYLVTAVLFEGRSAREVAAAHGVSKTWVYELLARYRAEGEAGLVARSRRPRRTPTKVSQRFEDEIVRVRKELVEAGYDAGAETIRVHLARRRRTPVPSVSTIWRVLKARGFVTAQPHKRPKSSYVRFSAELPNQCWQMDVTHVALASGTEVEILNVIDDHSRLCVASVARRVTKALDVVTTFHEAAARHGYPAGVLSDNGAIFTAEARHGVCALESELLELGISFRHSRPYHPQTCGKVERFHQTMKKHLAAQRAARSVGRSAGPARWLRRLLQHRPPSPVPGTPDPGGGLPGPQARPGRPTRRSRSYRIAASARTRSTPATSPCATGAISTTSPSAAVTKAPECWCSWPTATSGCSPPTARLLRRITLDPSRLYQPLGP